MHDNLSPTPKTNYPFRVFISYSHKDRDLVEKMVDILQGIGLQPLWDRDIHPGTPFTDSIKDLIARSHIFIPLLTENSQERPWVHQETGYAQAINIPILPITLADQNLSREMIAQLQAITVRPDMTDLVEHLQEIDLENLVFPSPRKPHNIVEIADWPETRAELIIQYMKWVTDLGVSGLVRHRASSTSFCIPDRNINDPIWKMRDGVLEDAPHRSDYFHHLQREERRAIESHARGGGCLLMMTHPEAISLRRGPIAKRIRLEILLAFFDSMTDDGLRVGFLPQQETGNVIMVGDYFVAESLVPRPGGWQQTVFNSHPPTVLQRVRRFDQEFEELYPRYGLVRAAAMDEIRRVIDTLPPIPVESRDTD